MPDELVCRMELNRAFFSPGAPFSLVYIVQNPYVRFDAFLFVALDVFGEYWFYPSWEKYEGPDFHVDFRQVSIRAGVSTFDLLWFTWPDTGSDACAGLAFWSLLTLPDLYQISGLEHLEFGFGPPAPTPTASPTPTRTPTPTGSPRPTATPPPGPSLTPRPPSPTPSTGIFLWDGETSHDYGGIVIGGCSPAGSNILGTILNTGGGPLTVTMNFTGDDPGDFGFSPATLGEQMEIVIPAGDDYQVSVFFCPQDFGLREAVLVLHPHSSQPDVEINLVGFGVV